MKKCKDCGKEVSKSAQKISYNALDWKIVDGKGVENSYALWGDDNNTSLSSGELNANGIKTGTISFEIPENVQNIKLKYYETILSSERAFEFKIIS